MVGSVNPMNISRVGFTLIGELQVFCIIRHIKLLRVLMLSEFKG